MTKHKGGVNQYPKLTTDFATGGFLFFGQWKFEYKCIFAKWRTLELSLSDFLFFNEFDKLIKKTF